MFVVRDARRYSVVVRNEFKLSSENWFKFLRAILYLYTSNCAYLAPAMDIILSNITLLFVVHGVSVSQDILFSGRRTRKWGLGRGSVFEATRSYVTARIQRVRCI